MGRGPGGSKQEGFFVVFSASSSWTTTSVNTSCGKTIITSFSCFSYAVNHLENECDGYFQP